VLLRTTVGGAKLVSWYTIVIRHSVAKNHRRRGAIPVVVHDRGAIPPDVLGRGEFPVVVHDM